jgi:hypothetical protein
MTSQQIANRLYELCSQGKNFDAMEELYTDDIVSVEATARGGVTDFKGKVPVIQKSRDWAAAHEIHGLSIQGPYLCGDKFAVTFDIDVTHKASGQRASFREVAVYFTSNGKIHREEFYYGS